MSSGSNSASRCERAPLLVGTESDDARQHVASNMAADDRNLIFGYFDVKASSTRLKSGCLKG